MELLVTVDGTTFSVVKDHYQKFWNSVASKEWEFGTLSLLGSLLKPGWQYFDIGTWMGPMALYGAALGAQTFGFEPDPVAFKRLTANIALNPDLADRLSIFNAAVGSKEGTLTLYADTLGNSETSVFADRDRGENSIHATEAFDVPMIDFGRFLQDNRNVTSPALIKVDIEGAEFDVVPHIASLITNSTAQTVVHLSTHAFNIVCDDPFEQEARRREAKRSVLEPFLQMHWYDFDSSKKLIKLDGQRVLNQAIGRLNGPDEIILSNVPLLS